MGEVGSMGRSSPTQRVIAFSGDYPGKGILSPAKDNPWGVKHKSNKTLVCLLLSEKHSKRHALSTLWHYRH